MADNTEKPRYVSHLSDEAYATFLSSPEAEAVRSFYKGFPDTIGIVKRAWKDAGYRWAEKNEPIAFLEMRCDNIREDFKGFSPSIVESKVNELRREHGQPDSKANLVGYRADREPDASWHRASNHRPYKHPSTNEQAADEKRRKENAESKEFIRSVVRKAAYEFMEGAKRGFVPGYYEKWLESLTPEEMEKLEAEELKNRENREYWERNDERRRKEELERERMRRRF